MEIKELLSYYVNALDFSVVQEGTRLCNYRTKEIIVKIFTTTDAVLVIPSESSRTPYTVNFAFYFSDKKVFGTCKCMAFKDFGECKHCAAAALYLINHWRQPQGPLKLAMPKPATISARTNIESGSRDRYTIPFASLSFQERKK